MTLNGPEPKVPEYSIFVFLVFEGSSRLEEVLPFPRTRSSSLFIIFDWPRLDILDDGNGLIFVVGGLRSKNNIRISSDDESDSGKWHSACKLILYFIRLNMKLLTSALKDHSVILNKLSINPTKYFA